MNEGTYVLVLALDVAATVRVGALGCARFPPGVYAYVGSAHGSGGLPARLARHRQVDKPPHWHIDYLRPHARLVETWQARGPARLECTWARALTAAPGAVIVAPGFGASDCTCTSHLFHFIGLDTLCAARSALGNPHVFPE